MQSLTATLLAEQKKPRATPYVKVIISDRLGPQQRLHWSKLYSDASADEPQAMIVTGDDSIVRVRSHAGTAQYQRVTDPTVEEQWTAWTGGVGACSIMNQMALATSGAHVWWFYISSDDMTLYCRESDDYGATWTSAATAHTCTGNYRLESVAAAHLSGTDPIVFFSVHDVTVALGCHLYRRKRVSGVWQSASSWGKSAVKRVRGLSCHKTGDYNMLYGAEVDAAPFGFEVGHHLWCLHAIAYGNGVDVPSDTWADPVLIERTDSGTAFATAWPSLAYVDLFRALFTGYLVGEEYSRVLRMRGLSSPTFLETVWTDPAPFKAEGGPFGMVIDHRPGGDGYVYAACSNAAYRAQAAGLGTVTFTDRVKRYQVRDHWRGHKGAGVAMDYGQLVAPVLEGEIWLDNSDGELSSLGSGDYQMVLRGSMVELFRGYLTTAGQESSAWPTMWLEDYEHVIDFQGRCYVVLHCVGGWGLLSAMSAQRQYHWQDGEASVWSIAERLFALAGFDLSTSGESSEEIGIVKPAFLVHPGQDLRGAVLSVLSKVGDFVYWEGPTPYVKELASDEASDYTYGGSGEHVIISGRYGVRSPGYDHIEVFAGVDEYGVPIFGDEVDYDEVDLIGHRLQKVYDYSYDTAAECHARAVAQLRKHDAAKRRGQIETLPNVGLQVFDVVTLTDARAGVSSEVYRVRGIEEVYDTTKDPLIFRQRVTLGAR
jgi:hypothetical protein